MIKPQFLNAIDRALAVRQHVILSLNTQDRYYWPEGDIRPCSLNYFLYHYFRTQGYRIALYVPAIGGSEMMIGGSSPPDHPVLGRLTNAQNKATVLNGLFDLLRINTEKWIILVQYGEHLSPANGGGSEHDLQAIEILHQIGMNDDVARGSSRVILITYEGLPANLLVQSPAWKAIQVGLPCLEERQSFIDFLENLRFSGRGEFGTLEQNLGPEELARITAGMPLLEIEALYRAGGHFQKPLSREAVREAKSSAIRQLARDLLQVSEPQEGFSAVAGMKTIKEYFTRLLIPQIRAGRPSPQAILLHGEPGCGKSHILGAIAAELGWPLLEFRSVRGPYVGQSEQQLEHVINLVEQLSPCVLFFDEIDQAIGQRSTGMSGDSGTSERMLARIFSWLGSMHLRGRVLFVGASNRPDLLDPALLDRFPVSIPVLKPSANEIGELLPLLMDRFALTATLDLDEAKSLFAAMKPSGRILQEIIVQAGMLADDRSGQIGSTITMAQLREATANCLNSEDPLEIEFIRLTSLALTSSQTFLPWYSIGTRTLRSPEDIPEDLLQSGVVDDQGKLNKQAVHRRLRELARERQIVRSMR